MTRKPATPREPPAVVAPRAQVVAGPATPLRMPPAEASAYLLGTWGIRRSVATLAKARCQGGGPVFHKAGRDVVYPRAGLDSWAVEQLGQPRERTGEAA